MNVLLILNFRYFVKCYYFDIYIIFEILLIEIELLFLLGVCYWIFVRVGWLIVEFMFSLFEGYFEMIKFFVFWFLFVVVSFFVFFVLFVFLLMVVLLVFGIIGVVGLVVGVFLVLFVGFFLFMGLVMIYGWCFDSILNGYFWMFCDRGVCLWVFNNVVLMLYMCWF